MYCLAADIRNPVIVQCQYQNMAPEKFLLYSATDLGGLQIDGFGDGIWLKGDQEYGFVNETAFGILQASRSRISKTDYISCPSCGRTLFDLQETTSKIRDQTGHLKGIKIGIMGCIVNGPGEMADADYGYVGTGPGKISLYKGQDVVARNIPAESAVDALINLVCHESYKTNTPIEELINNAYKTVYKISANNSPFETKDILKARGYNWNGVDRYWFKIIDFEDIEPEQDWNAVNVYNGTFIGDVIQISNVDKYK